MMFDRLCGILERVYRNEPMLRALRDARIFEFPGRLHEAAASRDWESFGGAEFLLDNFFLPFPVVAVEDSASCVVLIDNEPNARGLNVSRTVIECLDLRAPIEEFGLSRSDPAQVAAWNANVESSTLPPETCSIAVSKITGARLANDDERKAVPDGTGLVFAGELGFVFVANKREMVFSLNSSMRAMSARGDTSRYAEAATRNAVAALEEIMFFNTPDRFIVERSPDVPLKSGKRPNEIIRSPHRPHYIMLRPQEIRERLGIGDEPVHDRKSPTPHARRRHYRTLKADRFVNAQGKTVVVSASWVGPSEGEYKGRTYKVCLDL